MSENLLNYEDAAAKLGVSKATLQHWVSKKKIPHIKYGTGRNGSVRFVPADLDSYIASQRLVPAGMEANP